jgi:protoheme IX farnesyltransferase
MTVTSTSLQTGRAADYVELIKPNIVGMILLTVAAGFYMGAPGGALDVALLVYTLLGSALVAGGSNALNQILERHSDARMRRTRARPLPSGRLRVAQSAVFGWGLGAVGVAYLAVFTNWIVALLAALTLASYVFVYTPLKRVTSLATVIGAVPGALPIVGGWAASHGDLGVRAWVLFAILFLWQLPHFLALAWLYREDYARAGLRMLSVTQGGGATFRQALLYAVALLPVGILPTLLGMTGWIYFWGVLALTLWLVWATTSAALDRTPAKARRLFLVTVVYLPLVMGLLVVDKM